MQAGRLQGGGVPSGGKLEAGVKNPWATNACSRGLCNVTLTAAGVEGEAAESRIAGRVCRLNLSM